MPASPDTVSMAMFCDFENVALGVRDAKYDKFDIKPVLERLLLKGSIVVKKAYCDWERYKGFKATMHEANFELIEIPHVRQSGKNSADIRMVVDALDLCYTKAHVNTFVIVSGDSDFSPLVSKLRENAKYVIGVGIKQSTSDLLIANCDEFIFYDDLVRESQRSAARRDPKSAPQVAKRPPEELEARRSEAVELAVATFDALVVERGDSSRIWASMLKEAIKRRRPDFNENHFGFRAFGNLLDEAQARGMFEVGRDEKSGAFVFRGPSAQAQPRPALGDTSPAEERGGPASTSGDEAGVSGRRRGRGGRSKARGATADAARVVEPVAEAAAPLLVVLEPSAAPAPAVDAGKAARSRTGRASRAGRPERTGKASEVSAEQETVAPVLEHDVVVAEAPSAKEAATGRPESPKPAAATEAPRASRSSRSRARGKGEGKTVEAGAAGGAMPVPATLTAPVVTTSGSSNEANSSGASGDAAVATVPVVAGKKPAARRPRARKTTPSTPSEA